MQGTLVKKVLSVALAIIDSVWFMSVSFFQQLWDRQSPEISVSSFNVTRMEVILASFTLNTECEQSLETGEKKSL